MRVYELTTNEGKSFKRNCPTQKQHFAYIREKLKAGWKLKDILYTWTWHYAT